MGANMPQIVLLVVAIATVCQVVQAADKYTNENRPYEFGFKIPGEQHRAESKDEEGIVMGEFGFITGDGIYHVTVFATDKDGNYKILSMKHIRVGPSPWGAKTTSTTTTTTTTPAPEEEDYEFVLAGKPGCSGCLIPTPGPPGAPTRRPFRLPNKNKPPTSSNPPGASNPNNPPRPGSNPAFPKGPTPSGVFPASTSPGNGNTFPGSGNTFPGSGNPLPGSGNTFPGSGNPLPGSGNPLPGSPGPNQQNPRPVFGFPRPQSGPSFPNSPNGGQPGSSQSTDGLPAGVSEEDVMGLLYKFNYTVGFHGHQESGYRNGDKEGEYYTNFRDGTARKVSYVANAKGYRPKVTVVKLSNEDTPREETEKEYGLKGYEFKWFNRRK